MPESTRPRCVTCGSPTPLSASGSYRKYCSDVCERSKLFPTTYIAGESWREKAACSAASPVQADLAFSTKMNEQDSFIAIFCHNCPVIAECLSSALEDSAHWPGVRGGLRQGEVIGRSENLPAWFRASVSPKNREASLPNNVVEGADVRRARRAEAQRIRRAEMTPEQRKDQNRARKARLVASLEQDRLKTS